MPHTFPLLEGVGLIQSITCDSFPPKCTLTAFPCHFHHVSSPGQTLTHSASLLQSLLVCRTTMKSPAAISKMLWLILNAIPWMAELISDCSHSFLAHGSAFYIILALSVCGGTGVSEVFAEERGGWRWAEQSARLVLVLPVHVFLTPAGCIGSEWPSSSF